ncbi:MAG: hypothetical protein COC15_00015 [Legionellales bacterium]|nr:MAG: hypothetical protein COC15_00015 [Legionellales bacterium]
MTRKDKSFENPTENSIRRQRPRVPKTSKEDKGNDEAQQSKEYQTLIMALKQCATALSNLNKSKEFKRFYMDHFMNIDEDDNNINSLCAALQKKTNQTQGEKDVIALATNLEEFIKNNISVVIKQKALKTLGKYNSNFINSMVIALQKGKGDKLQKAFKSLFINIHAKNVDNIIKELKKNNKDKANMINDYLRPYVLYADFLSNIDNKNFKNVKKKFSNLMGKGTFESLLPKPPTISRKSNIIIEKNNNDIKKKIKISTTSSKFESGVKRLSIDEKDLNEIIATFSNENKPKNIQHGNNLGQELANHAKTISKVVPENRVAKLQSIGVAINKSLQSFYKNSPDLSDLSEDEKEDLNLAELLRDFAKNSLLENFAINLNKNVGKKKDAFNILRRNLKKKLAGKDEVDFSFTLKSVFADGLAKSIIAITTDLKESKNLAEVQVLATSIKVIEAGINAIVSGKAKEVLATFDLASKHKNLVKLHKHVTAIFTIEGYIAELKNLSAGIQDESKNDIELLQKLINKIETKFKTQQKDLTKNIPVTGKLVQSFTDALDKCKIDKTQATTVAAAKEKQYKLLKNKFSSANTAMTKLKDLAAKEVKKNADLQCYQQYFASVQQQALVCSSLLTKHQKELIDNKKILTYNFSIILNDVTIITEAAFAKLALVIKNAAAKQLSSFKTGITADNSLIAQYITGVINKTGDVAAALTAAKAIETRMQQNCTSYIKSIANLKMQDVDNVADTKIAALNNHLQDICVSIDGSLMQCNVAVKLKQLEALEYAIRKTAVSGESCRVLNVFSAGLQQNNPIDIQSLKAVNTAIENCKKNSENITVKYDALLIATKGILGEINENQNEFLNDVKDALSQYRIDIIANFKICKKGMQAAHGHCEGKLRSLNVELQTLQTEAKQQEEIRMQQEKQDQEKLALQQNKVQASDLRRENVRNGAKVITLNAYDIGRMTPKRAKEIRGLAIRNADKDRSNYNKYRAIVKLCKMNM